MPVVLMNTKNDLDKEICNLSKRKLYYFKRITIYRVSNKIVTQFKYKNVFHHFLRRFAKFNLLSQKLCFAKSNLVYAWEYCGATTERFYLSQMCFPISYV